MRGLGDYSPINAWIIERLCCSTRLIKLPFQVSRTYLKLNIRPQLGLNYQKEKKRATLTKLSKTPSASNLLGQLDNGNSSSFKGWLHLVKIPLHLKEEKKEPWNLLGSFLGSQEDGWKVNLDKRIIMLTELPNLYYRFSIIDRERGEMLICVIWQDHITVVSIN